MERSSEAGRVLTERPAENAGPGRRRTVVAATLIVGTATLGATLASPAGSGWFYGLGLLAAMVWTAGGLLSGPICWTRGARSVSPSDVALPILAGVALYGGFAAAKLMADQVPLLSHSVDSVLARADAGPRVLALVVALVNGVGEEVLFRGALHDAFDHYRSLRATVIYGVVTIATLNVALVAAAVVMGSVFALERRASGGILAPILTHLSWSILVLFFLPR